MKKFAMFMDKKKLFKEIEEAELYKKYKPEIYKIDWGRIEKQGKRRGQMVTGGMSNAPQGIKTYINLLSGIPEYKTFKEDFKILDSRYEQILYLKAREYGLNHEQALIYVIAKTDESLTENEILNLLNKNGDKNAFSYK